MSRSRRSPFLVPLAQLTLALGLGTLSAGAVRAQSLPPFGPLNPVAASRTGLAFQPWVAPGKRWQVALLLDHGSLIEYADTGDVSYVLDAEVLRLQAGITRNLGRRAFLLAEASFNGAYDGFLDGFLDWYHDLTGFQVKARELRPTNQFAYRIELPGDRSHVYGKSSGFLGDLRVGAGLHHTRHWQSSVSITLPLGSSPAGYRRGTVSLNGTTHLRAEFLGRFVYEGSFGLGYTPTHGELADLQRKSFVMVTQGLRGRVSGVLHAYSNVFYHSPYYRGTGILSLDRRELSIDVGGMLRFRRGPEWIFGLSEDLEPSGPAYDVGFRLGARW